MLREQARVFARLHRALDLGLTVVAFVGAYWIKKYLLPAPFGGLSTEPNYYVVLLMIVIIWYPSFAMFDLYASYRKQSFGQIFRSMLKAVSVGMLVLILCMYVFKVTNVSRIMLGLFFFLNIGFLTLSKGFVYWLLARYRRKGLNFRNVLIIGSRERAINVIESVRDQLGSGYTIMGCLDPDETTVGNEVQSGVRVIGTLDTLQDVLTTQVVDELVFAIPASKIENVSKYILLAMEVGVSVHIMPDWYIQAIQPLPGFVSPSVKTFLGVPTMSLVTTSNHRAEILAKTAFDYIFAGILSILLLPLFLLIVATIKISSRGPIFFKQERSGLNGRRFMLYKFRTMVADAEAKRAELETLNETDGPVFKIKKDPRIIPYVGTFLRKTGLDELPQLINILRGEMSFIGPRPPIPSEVEQYDLWQRRRLSMKPGLTCIWQCTPNRNDVDFESWMKMDLRYIDTWSLGLDARLFLKTIQVVLLGSGR